MYLIIYIFSFGTIHFGVFMIRKNMVPVRYLTAYSNHFSSSNSSNYLKIVTF